MEDMSIKNELKPTASPQRRHTARRIMAAASAVVAVVAWVVFFCDATAAFVVALVALVCALPGIGVGRGCLRDISITALIASAVLTVVYCIFFWGVPAIVASL